MLDHSNLNNYERDEFNAAFDNTDSLVDTGEVGTKMSTVCGFFGEWGGCFRDGPSNPTGCFGAVQVDTNNGGDTLNAI